MLLASVVAFQLVVRRKNTAMDTENGPPRPSALRPPSRSRLPTNLPAAVLAQQQHAPPTQPASGLHEVSDSQNNTRAQSSLLPAPSAGIKRALLPPGA